MLTLKYAFIPLPNHPRPPLASRATHGPVLLSLVMIGPLSPLQTIVHFFDTTSEEDGLRNDLGRHSRAHPCVRASPSVDRATTEVTGADDRKHARRTRCAISGRRDTGASLDARG